MREIKFRAWYPEIKFFKYYDFLYTAQVERFGEDKWDLENLTQFTGLKDKNGKEIYEGDIVKQQWFKPKKDVLGQVIFRDGCFWGITMVFIPTEGDKAGKMDLTEKDTEIIGNIYENMKTLIY